MTIVVIVTMLNSLKGEPVNQIAASNPRTILRRFAPRWCNMHRPSPPVMSQAGVLEARVRQAGMPIVLAVAMMWPTACSRMQQSHSNHDKSDECRGQHVFSLRDRLCPVRTL
jgi:hypothetical protein